MTLRLLMAATSEGEGVEHTTIAGFPPQAIAYGAGAFIAFLVLLIIVTRLNVLR